MKYCCLCLLQQHIFKKILEICKKIYICVYTYTYIHTDIYFFRSWIYLDPRLKQILRNHKSRRWGDVFGVDVTAVAHYIRSGHLLRICFLYICTDSVRKLMFLYDPLVTADFLTADTVVTNTDQISQWPVARIN